MSDNKPVKTDGLKAYGELLNDIPKVRASAWGNDFGLGLAHRNAVKLAYEISSEYSKEDRDKTLSDILRILYLWKNERGIYPAYSTSRRGQFISSLLGKNDEKIEPPISAKEYDLQIIKRQEKGEKVEIPDPWECCPYVSTPLGLFDRIWAENYEPLNTYLSENFHLFPLIKCILIVLSNATTETHNTDCINAAMTLANIQMDLNKKRIAWMMPLATETFNKRRAARLKRNTEKEQTAEKIIGAYNKYTSTEPIPKNLQELISLDTGVKQSTVSKCLKSYGLNKKSRKKLS